MPNYSLKSPENTDEWDRYLLFRWEMLRKPLGMSMESLADDIEDKSFHLMGIDHDGNVIASGRVHFNSEHEAQIRYMGVSDGVRRMGVGTSMVNKLEDKAKTLGAKYVTLNARNIALDFYKSLGYIEIEPYESDIKIPHTRMEKILT